MTHHISRLANMFSEPSDACVTVVAYPTFKSQAERAVQLAGKENAIVADVRWTLFPDGTPSTKLTVKQIEGKHVLYWADCSSMKNMFEFLGVLYALPRYHAKTLSVVMPFYPTGTMERVDVEGEVATAKTLARLVSATPTPLLGNTNLFIFDMHALPTRFFFSDHIHVKLLSAIPLLHDVLAEMQKSVHNVSIAFPDEGSRKRFGKMFKEFPHIICSKIREGDKRRLTVSEGDPKGRHCVIVDDLVQTGGTLITCRDTLYSAGATAVSAYCTHGVFPKEGWKKMLVENTEKGKKPFVNFFLTDSVPVTAAAVEGKAPFRILSIAPLVARMLIPDVVAPTASTKAKL